MKYLITIILTTLFSACQESNRYLQNISEEENVKEVVFRIQIKNRNDNRIFYLAYTSIDSESKELIYNDPSSEFIHRFDDLPQKVKAFSKCVLSDFGVKDKITGERGIILRISSIRWLSETEAFVEAGSYMGPTGASGVKYRVQFQGKKWIVVSSKAMWIS
jgi:hypothetical protein